MEHLLGVIVENREQRCQDVRDKAALQATDIIKQAYTRGRARLRRHINELREKYRLRVASAHARNQTLLRRQHQKEERAIIDVAWPMLNQAMLALWKKSKTRHQWLDAAMVQATELLRQQEWYIEHPQEFSEADKQRIVKKFAHGREPGMKACEDIDAGVRIIIEGTVVDATLGGLLKQRTAIEARMIARIKQGAASHG